MKQVKLSLLSRAQSADAFHETQTRGHAGRAAAARRRHVLLGGPPRPAAPTVGDRGVADSKSAATSRPGVLAVTVGHTQAGPPRVSVTATAA